MAKTINKAIVNCTDNAQKIHLIIEEIKKYAIKAGNVRTVKAYNNNMEKFHVYCKELTDIMGKNYVYHWISTNQYSNSGKNVPWKIVFTEYDEAGKFVQILPCFVRIPENLKKSNF